MKFPKLPKVVLLLSILAVVISFVPHAIWIKSRFSRTDLPRVHPVPDMDNQLKYKAQKESTLFADGQTFRQPVAGTVAQGELRDDAHLYTGKIGDAYATYFPAAIPVDANLMARGRERFNIYCTPCHGYLGDGDGAVTRRAAKARQPWVRPTNMRDAAIVEKADGYLFDVITRGVRNMSGYAAQIPANDRWAIVAYVRALQATQTTFDNVPADAPYRATLESQLK